MNHLGTETAFEVFARAKALEAKGRDIVHLEIGEPDFDTPKNIVDAAMNAIGKGYTHYGPSAGLPEARAAIAEYVAKTARLSRSTRCRSSSRPAPSPLSFFTVLALLDPGR
jgi:aspartate/methionine/tyrosine aminotransferase